MWDQEKKILGVQKTPWKQKSKSWERHDEQANMTNRFHLQVGRGVKRNSRIIGWISWVKDKVMKRMEGAHKGKKRERQMSFREEMWKSKRTRDTGRFRTKRESQKYWKGPRRQYSKKNEDNTGRNDRKRGQKWKWSQRWQKRERENCTTRDKQNFENKSKVRTTMWTNRQKEEERAE